MHEFTDFFQQLIHIALHIIGYIHQTDTGHGFHFHLQSQIQTLMLLFQILTNPHHILNIGINDINDRYAVDLFFRKGTGHMNPQTAPSFYRKAAEAFVLLTFVSICMLNNFLQLFKILWSLLKKQGRTVMKQDVIFLFTVSAHRIKRIICP